MRDGPRRQLSPREESVAELIGRGWSYKRVAIELKLGRGDPLRGAEYVRTITMRIADLLPEDDVSPRSRVMLWAAHRRWLKESYAAKNAA